MIEFQSRLVEAVAESANTREAFLRLESHGIVHRLDPSVEPDVFRGANLSESEMEALRQIDNLVRLGRVRRVATDQVILERGAIPSDRRQVHVDCSASAFKPARVRPVFEGDRITTQLVTFGNVPWSGATLGYVEATRDDEEEKNHFCPPLGMITGDLSDPPRVLYIGLKGPALRMAEPDLAAWNEDSRLNPARGVREHLDDPRVQTAFARLAANMEPAIANLERILAATSSASVRQGESSASRAQDLRAT